MGMTIEEAIEMLKSYNHGFTGYVSNLQDSIDIAIATMEKYQKIIEIVDDWENNDKEDDSINIIDNIEEVIEDGKID